MKQVLRSRQVVTAQGVRPACVVFEEGRITSVEEFGTASIPGESGIDVGDLYVLPGLIDTHVHINEPGRTDWEGFRTGTLAAAAGGCTCIVDMPLNSIPAVTSVAALQEKRKAALGSCSVDYAFWGGVVPGNESELLSLANAGVRGFKCFLIDSGVAEFTCVAEVDLNQAMPLVAMTGLPLLVHAELSLPLPCPYELARDQVDWTDYRTHLASRPDEWEVRAVEMMIRLARTYSCRVHIVHLSSAKALPVITQARAEGLPITVETCPHYLYFSAEAVPPMRTDFKCAPPIRDAVNRELLWEALRTGTIDLVATDHSPCPPELKGLEKGSFQHAWGGVASLSIALSVMWTSAKRHRADVRDLVRWMCEKPAALAGFELHKGRIAEGYDADLIVFDPDARFEVTPGRLPFRHPVSPYIGELLEGEVKMTLVRGNCVFSSGTFADERPGIETSPWPLAAHVK